MGKDECQHDWQMFEDGYQRTWSATVETDDDGNVVKVNPYDDTFSDDGDADGERLRCLSCSIVVPLEPSQIAWF